ncbi:MAG: MFS transporter [Caulobacterales bacterium]
MVHDAMNASADQTTRPRGQVITSLRNAASLIAAVLIMQVGQGLLNVQIPLAFEYDGFSRTAFGFVAAIYSAGFMFGAWYGPVLLARVGHIRVFSACAAFFAVATMGLHWAHGLVAWIVLRLIAGASVAMMFAAVESWMSGAIAKSERGSVMGFYQVGTKAALAIGPFFAIGYAQATAEPWMIAAAAIALALVPICFTSKSEPPPPASQTLAIRSLFKTAPAAVIACFGAGIINSGVMAFAPIYAVAHYGADAARGFYAAAWIGSLILQWPAGRYSDFVDRRIVIAALSGMGAVCAVVLAIFGHIAPLWFASLMFAFWGAGSLCYYGVAVAHMADRAEPSRIAEATSGLLFVWAAGAIVGPAIQGVVGDVIGPEGVFWFAAVTGGALAAAMFWRSGARKGPEAKEHFSVNQATSVAAAESAFGPDEAADSEASNGEARR